MKRFLLPLLFMVACFGQVRPDSPIFLQGTADPGKCAGLTFVWREDTHVLKVCYDTTILALTTAPTAAGFTAEDVSNKSTTVTLGSSDTLYPSQKAVKTYVDAGIAGLWCKYSVANSTTNLQITACDGSTSLVAKAAGTSQSVVLAALAANSFIGDVRVKTRTAFLGTTTLTSTLGATGSLGFYLTSAYDLKAAVSATNFTPATGIPDGQGAPTAAGTNLILALTSTVDNISSLSAGVVDIWVRLTVLP